MFKLRNMLVAGFIGAFGLSGLNAAEMLKGQERTEFVANATKGCVGTYGNDQSVKMSKPQFNQYCACMATGLADRLSKEELITEGERSDWSKEHEAVVNEETVRCLPKEAVRASYVANSVKACVGTHGDSESRLIAKPIFEQYCTCMANRVADRLSVADIMKLERQSRSESGNGGDHERGTDALFSRRGRSRILRRQRDEGVRREV